jgi:hypothetical protein
MSRNALITELVLHFHFRSRTCSQNALAEHSLQIHKTELSLARCGFGLGHGAEQPKQRQTVQEKVNPAPWSEPRYDNTKVTIRT